MWIDLKTVKAYLARMRRRRLISSYLAWAIFILQSTGLHVHAHDHAGPHDASEPERIHLAIATDHSGDKGKHHDQDVEVSETGIGIIKKAGIDEDLPGPLPLGHFPQVLSVQAGQIPAASHSPKLRQPYPFTRPYLRAPPELHFV